MLVRSFAVTSASPPKEMSCRPATIMLSKRHNNNGNVKSPCYSKWKESSPIYDTSSRRHYQRDLFSQQDMTTVTMSNTGCLLATTPLSPVHEAKEPRQNHNRVYHELCSPTTDDSPGEMSPAKRKIFSSECTLPELEKCNTAVTAWTDDYRRNYMYSHNLNSILAWYSNVSIFIQHLNFRLLVHYSGASINYLNCRLKSVVLMVRLIMGLISPTISISDYPYSP